MRGPVLGAGPVCSGGGAVHWGARYNDGYVIFFVNPARIELSLTLFLLLALILRFAALYFFIRAAAYTLGLPERVRLFREGRAREKARHALFDALVSSLEGRYARAEKAAASAYAAGEEPGLAALLAARAAHELAHAQERDAWLARATEASQQAKDPAIGHATLMTRASLLSSEHRDLEALDRDCRTQSQRCPPHCQPAPRAQRR